MNFLFHLLLTFWAAQHFSHSTFTPTSFVHKVSNMSKGGVIAYDIVLALAATYIILIIIFLIIIKCRKKSVKSEDNQEPILVKRCAQPCPLADVDAATDGFSHRRVIGEGRLGTVYAAISPSGEVSAVKRINPRFVLSNAGFGFSTIIKSLSLAQHPNVVPIMGYSEAPGERIIVLEFVGMKSLDFYLHQDPMTTAPILDWGRRLRIVSGAARGLEYLHESMAPSVVHGCIKPSNILLDGNLDAKICDYGLSFLAPRERRGLVGYVDREYWVEKGGVCKASDVYAFGVVLLEVLSGRMCEEGLVVEWALPLIREKRIVEVLDPRVLVPMDMNPLVRLAKVASACVGNSRQHRPSIAQVATILNNLEIQP